MQNLKNFIIKHQSKFILILALAVLLLLGLFLDFEKLNFNTEANPSQSYNKSSISYQSEADSTDDSKKTVKKPNTTITEKQSSNYVESKSVSSRKVFENKSGSSQNIAESKIQIPSADKTTTSQKSLETVESEKEKPQKTLYSCTISISCSTILNNIENCKANKVDIVPQDGWILKPLKVDFTEGETVFDVLQRTCRENNIQMESNFNPIYSSAYIEGIANIYEFDVGQLSGWQYSVDGDFPNFGCSLYKLKDGQNIKWLYTCNMNDLKD